MEVNMGNEITVKMKCTVAEIKEILKERKFMKNIMLKIYNTDMQTGITSEINEFKKGAWIS